MEDRINLSYENLAQELKMPEVEGLTLERIAEFWAEEYYDHLPVEPKATCVLFRTIDNQENYNYRVLSRRD